MRRVLAVVLAAFYLSLFSMPALAQAQIGRQTKPTLSPRPAPPRLGTADSANIRDEVARAGDQYVIYRSGANIPVPLTPGAVLRLGLDAALSTSKLKEGQIVPRLLALRTPLQNPFNVAYAEKDILVETEFSGRASGFKNRSILLIRPRRFQIEVGPTEYKVVGMVDNLYVALKPGKWRFDLECSLTQVVSPEGDTWTVRGDSETGALVGRRVGSDGKPQFNDVFDPLVYLPHGTFIYAVTQLKRLFMALIHRPNMTLPVSTDVYFRVNRLTATYVGPSVPSEPATIIR
jgi:hypothetical protein